MSTDAKAALVELLEEKKRRKAQNKLADFEPYEWQKEFCNASAKYTTRYAQAGNRVGKSLCAAYEVTIHATGLYPDWWTGRRFDHPTRQLCSGVSAVSVRDIMQSKLLGDSAEPSLFGTGMIPKKYIGKTTRRAGIPDAIAAVLIKHKSGGWSKISFLSYESGKEAFMGTSFHHVNLDEEPPMDIYSQAVRSVLDTDGLITVTATPENGITELVHKFTNDKLGTYYVKNVTWDDAPHLTPEVQEKMLREFPEHEWDMRKKGIPVLGSGLVFPVAEEELRIPPMEIPSHWKRIGGLDFGIDHPTAWVSLAYDADADVIYVVDCLRKSDSLPSQVASLIKQKGGNKYPTAWPHDGLIRDKTSGNKLKDMYKEEGLEMLPNKFSNPPSPGKEEGTGGNSVEFGLQWMLERMKSDRFKVFSTLTDWFEEYRSYHRKDGKVVAIRDDLMAATRYAALSLRFARSPDQKFECYIPQETDFNDPMVAY